MKYKSKVLSDYFSVLEVLNSKCVGLLVPKHSEVGCHGFVLGAGLYPAREEYLLVKSLRLESASRVTKEWFLSLRSL